MTFNPYRNTFANMVAYHILVWTMNAKLYSPYILKNDIYARTDTNNQLRRVSLVNLSWNPRLWFNLGSRLEREWLDYMYWLLSNFIVLYMHIHIRHTWRKRRWKRMYRGSATLLLIWNKWRYHVLLDQPGGHSEMSQYQTIIEIFQ